MATTRRSFILATLGATLAPAAARAADEATLLAAARKDGKVVVYSNADPGATDRVLRAFTAKYQVPAELQRLTGAALAQRFMAEYETGNNIADLFISSDPVFPRDAIKKGILVRQDDLPAYDAWPKDGFLDGLVPLNINPYVLAWNSSIIPDGLTSFEALNDPRWRGKVMVGDPRVLASARLWYLAIIQKYGEGFLRELGKHATYSPSVVPGMQQLAAGSVAIYAPTILLSANDIMDKGAPVKVALADPVVISQSLGAIPAKAPHRDAARLLLNYWMTHEGQAIYSRNSYTLLKGVPGTRMIGDHVDIDPDAGERELNHINALLGLG
jgi:iron(III) transport system substrate-binding protein